MEDFHKSFGALIEFCSEVSKYKSDGAKIINGSGSIGLMVNYFITCYNKNKNSKKHYDRTLCVYNSIKRGMLKCNNIEELSFYLNPNGSKPLVMNITYEGSTNKLRLPLSIIYRKCIQICDDISKEKKDNDDEFTKMEYWPEFYVYFLMKVFYNVASLENNSEEKEKIQTFINELENALSIEDEDNIDYADEMASMFDIVGDFAEETGMKIPKNITQISKKDRKDAMMQLKNVAKDPRTKKAVDRILNGINLESIENVGDIPEVIERIAVAMKEGASETPEAIKKANIATADNPDPDA